jgi:hypothetical protein
LRVSAVGERVSERANYATVEVGAELGPEQFKLDLDWTRDAGDATALHEFEVPTADPREAYVGIQAFDVEFYGHEVELNGDPLGGFDIPPGEGWQYWVDTVSGADLRQGTNTLRVRRDRTTMDRFAIGTVTVHWKEPVEE